MTGVLMGLYKVVQQVTTSSKFKTTLDKKLSQCKISKLAWRSFSLESHVPWALGLWQLLNIATTWATNPYEISTNLKDEWSGVWVVSLWKCFLSIPKDTVICGYVELEEMVMLWRIPSSPEAFYTIVFQTHWEINRTASLFGGTSNS